MDKVGGVIENTTRSIEEQEKAWAKLANKAGAAANKILNGFKPLAKQDLSAADATKNMRERNFGTVCVQLKEEVNGQT